MYIYIYVYVTLEEDPRRYEKGRNVRKKDIFKGERRKVEKKINFFFLQNSIMPNFFFLFGRKKNFLPQKNFPNLTKKFFYLTQKKNCHKNKKSPLSQNYI